MLDRFVRPTRGALRVSILVPILAIALAGGAGELALGAGGGLKGTRHPSFEPVNGDTQVVYGPSNFSTPNGSSTNHVERFGLAIQPGQRYTLQVTNGNSDGSHRVTGGSVVLNGSTILSSSDLGNGATGWTKVVEALTEDTVQVTVQGSAGSNVTVSLLSTPDSSFLVFGPQQFVRATGQPVTDSFHFSIAATAAAPYRMCLTNGNIDGSHRVSSANIVLNGVTILTTSDLNQQIGSLMKDVSLQANNTLLVTLGSQPDGFITLCLTATDTTPPTIAITQPANNFITRDSLVAVLGTVQDETPTTVTVNGAPASMTGASFSDTVHLTTEGNTVLQIVATDAAGHSTDSTRTVIHDTQPPILTLTSPMAGLITNQTSATVSGSVTDLTAVTVNVNGIPLPVDGAGQFTGTIALSEGSNVLTVTATDAATNASSQVRTVTRDTQAPVITLNQPVEGATITTTNATLSGTVVDATHVTLTANGVAIVVGGDGTFTGSVPLNVGANAITLVATDAATNSSTLVRNVTRTSPLPPDPSTVASVLNRVQVSTIGDATAFLYSGTNPIQTGVAPGTINVVRAAVLRGRVLDKTLQPLSGAAVSILNHPELGQTLSRADGGYDLAVNGGNQLTVAYAKTGFLPAQRVTTVPWQDYTTLDDVVMLQPDTAVTVVDLTAQSPVFARSSPDSDADGRRQATIIFKPGTQATLTNPDGSTQPLTSLAVRTTEFTVGDSGLLSMPAALPPTSQYTYAMNISTDEQLAAGPGAVVTFSQPVAFYVTNFLHVPDGTAIPLGVYDPTTATWVPQPNGIALKVLGTDGNGRAMVDINGDGVADPPAALAALGIDDFELVQLAGAYPAGADLWRALAIRTEAGDLNLPYVFVGTPPTDGKVKAGCSSREGDPVRCQLQAQTAFQTVGLVGSPFTLNYASDRTQGDVADRTLDITLTGPTLQAQLLRVELEVDVAGQRFRGAFDPQPNLTYTFHWDGKDIYGRLVQGTQPATVLIGYVFPVDYAAPANATDAFGLPCAPSGTGSLCAIIANPQTGARQERTLAERLDTSIGTFDAAALGLGGFTLDVQQVYDPVGEVLYAGDGTRLATSTLPPGIQTTIGGCSASCLAIHDSGSALRAGLGQIGGMLFGPDGSLYFSDISSSAVRRVTTDGIIRTVAGGCGIFCPFSDSGPALQMNLGTPRGLAFGPDGSLYIADGSSGSVVRRMSPNGATITTYVGIRNSFGFNGDNIPAKTAKLTGPTGLAVGPDGALYIGDRFRVRRVDASGIITTVAGTGTGCSQGTFTACGDGGVATKALLGVVGDVKFGPDGSMYVGEAGNDFRVRRVGPDGVIHTVAGNSSGDGTTSTGDGGLATLAALGTPGNLAIGADGSLYIGEGAGSGNSFRVRRVTPAGFITTFAGTGTSGFSGEGGPAPAAMIQRTTVDAIGFGPDGNLYLGGGGRIRKVTGFLPGFGAGQSVIASVDGSQLYVFSPTGRILLTLDASTRDTVLSFAYDSALHLVSITDRFGQKTLIQRDGAGVVTGVVTPYGQATAIAVSGGLLSIAGPDNHPTLFTFNGDGLLASSATQDGATTLNTFDASGRLGIQTLPDSGATSLAVTTQSDGSTTGYQSGEGVHSTITSTTLPNGSQVTTTTNPDGLTTTVTTASNGVRTTQTPDGVTITATPHPDPRDGMDSPLQDVVVRMPSGLTMTRRTAAAVTFDDFGDPTSETDSAIVNGRALVATYNHLTHSGIVSTPGGRSRSLKLDDNGLILRDSVAGFLATAYEYDTAGHVLTRTQGGRLTHYTYDAKGRLASTTDPVGQVHRFSYDNEDRLSLTISPAGDSAFRAYDLVGHEVARAAPGRPAHRFEYYPTGLPKGYELPDVGGGADSVASAFNLDGQPAVMARASGDTVVAKYDSTGRLASISTKEGLFSYAYDPSTGRLHSVSSPVGGTLSQSYDGTLPTLTSWSGVVNGSVSTSYNNDLRPIDEQVDGSNDVTFAYDGDGLLSSAGALTISRDAGKFLVSGMSLGSVTTAATYDAYGAIKRLTTNYNGSAIADFQYQRDSIGRVIQATEQLLTSTTSVGFGYDSTGRLSSVSLNGASEATYEYDANGNRIRSVTSSGDAIGTYDGRDRLTAFGDASYSYSPDGFLASRILGADTTRYSFAALGELLQVDMPGGTEVDYIVDARGRRIGKKVDGRLTRAWLYSSNTHIAAELDSLGHVVSRFVYADDQDETGVPEYMTKNGNTYRLVTDQLGSIRLVVDVSSGAIVQQLSYDAFGQITANSNPGFQPFGFAGGLYDDDTKLTHFAWREYDAEVGRWISRDPILFQGGDDNLYAYAGDDPVNHRDLLGLQTLADENEAMDENEKLERDNYRNTEEQEDNVLQRVCKTVTALAKVTAQVHHVLFRALGGGEEGNRIWLETDIHQAFHSYMYSVFGDAGLPPLNTSASTWQQIIGEPGPQREAVKAALLAGADAFDDFCKTRARLVVGPGRGDIGDVTTMRSVMEQYFKDIGW